MEWKPEISGELMKEPVYIHFDFDEFRPWLMEKVRWGEDLPSKVREQQANQSVEPSPEKA